MERSYEEEKADIQRALIYAMSFEKPVWSQIAARFNVLYPRLLARAKGRGDRSHSGGHNKALNTGQEAALYRILDRMEHDGMYCR